MNPVACAAIVLALVACVLGAALGGLTIGRRTSIGISIAALLGALGASVVVTTGALVGLSFGLGVDGSWAVSSAACLGAAWLGGRTLLVGWRPLLATLRDEVAEARPVGGVVAALVVAQSAAALFQLLRAGDVGWDSSAYHFPMAASMIQSGSLFDAPVLHPWMAYPALVESQAALLASAFGSSRAASAVQLPYLFWLLALVGALVARFGAPRAAVATVLATAAIPTV